MLSGGDLGFRVETTGPDGVTGKLVVEALAESVPGRRVVYMPRRSDVAGFLAGEVRPGDLVLTLGAGDITMVADETLERILGTA